MKCLSFAAGSQAATGRFPTRFAAVKFQQRLLLLLLCFLFQLQLICLAFVPRPLSIAAVSSSVLSFSSRFHFPSPPLFLLFPCSTSRSALFIYFAVYFRYCFVPNLIYKSKRLFAVANATYTRYGNGLNTVANGNGDAALPLSSL